MNLLEAFLWFITIGLFIFFCTFWLAPFLKNKITFWWLSLKIRRMAKKYDGETKKNLNRIADGLMDLSRNENIDDED